MADLTSDLGIAIAEPYEIVADLDTPVAETLSIESNLDGAVAETHEISADLDEAIAGSHETISLMDSAVAETQALTADLELRIKTQEMHLLPLNTQIVDPLIQIKDLIDQYRDPLVFLSRPGDTVEGFLLGAPVIRVLHQVNDELVRCTLAQDCESCVGKIRGHIVVAWNLWDRYESRLKILVGGERLGQALYASALRVEDFGRKAVRILNIGRVDHDYRDNHHEVQIMDNVETPESFWQDLENLELFNLVIMEDSDLFSTVL